MARESTIQLRVSLAEKDAIEARAKKNGKKVSDFLRDLALQGFEGSNCQTQPTNDSPETVETLTQKIWAREGIPRPLARRMAEEQPNG